MTSTDGIERLYKRLAESGLPRKYVQGCVLPEWWSDEIASSEIGYLEAQAYVAKYLGVDLAMLRDEDAPIRPSLTLARFKMRGDVSEDDLEWSRAIAVRAAEIAAYAAPGQHQGMPTRSAEEIRSQIQESGVRWVSVESLIDFCWSIGIPVIHVSNFPAGHRKMTGMAVIVHDRPVIVVAENRMEGAWLSFVIAHELGHIASGHLADGEFMADDAIDMADSDELEQEANTFAVQLLTADDGLEFTLPRWRLPKAKQLAEQAKKVGGEIRVDPGVIVLNLAWHHSKNIWPLAGAALKEIEPDANTPQMLRSKMAENLDLDRLPDASVDFLLRVTGASDLPIPA